MVAAAGDSRSNNWLFGPATDLLLGCGGLYAIAVVVLLFAGPSLRETQPSLLFPLLAMFAGTPHYGATLLRVYEHRRDRRSYWLFSLWATLAVAATLVAGLWIPAVGMFLVTLYLTWSPWHYTGQNYGIAVMMLRRNGVAFTATDKRWIYASFVLSYVMVFLILHGGSASPDAPADYQARGIGFQPLGIPVAALNIIVPGLAVAAGVALVGAGYRLLRLARPGALVPAGMLALTQVLWFTLPLLLKFFGSGPARAEVLDWNFRVHYFMWIATGHFVQYLWVTSYTARKSDDFPGYGLWYAKILAAGSAIWAIPTVLLSPLGVGPLSLDLGLGVLIASAVNVHHFVLDGAIWKLKGRVAEVLIRSGTETLADSPRTALSVGLRRSVWATCFVGLLLYGFQVVQKEALAQSRRNQDLTGMQAAWDRLQWLGLDEASGRAGLGRRLLNDKQPTEARVQFRRSLELASTPSAVSGLAETYSLRGQWKSAALVLERGLEEAPESLLLLTRGAQAWRLAAEPSRAASLIERAADIAPDHSGVAAELERVRNAQAEPAS